MIVIFENEDLIEESQSAKIAPKSLRDLGPEDLKAGPRKAYQEADVVYIARTENLGEGTSALMIKNQNAPLDPYRVYIEVRRSIIPCN